MAFLCLWDALKYMLQVLANTTDMLYEFMSCLFIFLGKLKRFTALFYLVCGLWEKEANKRQINQKLL